jgi:type I restriction enzyme S subunit
MEMRKITLGDCIIDCASGPFGSNLKVECFVEDGFPIIDGANLKGVRVTDNITKFVTEEKARSLSRSIAKRRDVIVTISGTLGQISFIPNDSKYNEYLCSQRQFRVTFDESKIDVEYLVNYLHTDFGQKKILSFANYVGVPALAQPLPNFKKIELLIPSIQNQKKVVQVLSALDDKIALIKKMNQKLEAMAKRLYDYWFVQYDFPDKNGRPYKTTGGPMTFNATLKREIPVGWEVSNICPLMEILPGGTPSKAKSEYWNGDIPFFGPTDYCGDVFQLSTEEHITENGLNNCASALYPPKTIFITARGSVGKLIVCGKPMAMNQSCYALKPFDLEKYEYLFYLTKQLIEQLKKKGSGSVFKSINTLDIEQSFLSIAPNEIIDLYCKKVKSIFERIKSNTVEIAKLTTLRDKLLPLLMNGQVVVG